ncbi:hypothetical protein BH23VER1_BH23VER1_28830 [soil metagenome]
MKHPITPDRRGAPALQSAADQRRSLCEKLANSSLFSIYQHAFREATGLPLEICPVDDAGAAPCQGEANQNAFCQLLNSSPKGPCIECVRAQHRLVREAGGGMRSISCFAGLQETVVPVRLGGTVVALLKTGQVCHRKPTLGEFREALGHLGDSLSAEQRAPLKKAYLMSPVVGKVRYDATVTLLAAFSLQLGGLANRIAIEEGKGEPHVVAKAKAFIEDHMEDEICLGAVSQHVGVSRFYFCKVFKQSTGMTLTEFVGRRRIEKAKALLLRTDRRVTDIAFGVGFQSLSQFNRSFARFAGESPSEFRARASRARTDGLAA